MRFSKSVVIGTKSDGYTVDGWLKYVVNAHPEATPNPGDVGVAVQARQHTHPIDP
jgi:hypothetical protein